MATTSFHHLQRDLLVLLAKLADHLSSVNGLKVARKHRDHDLLFDSSLGRPYTSPPERTSQMWLIPSTSSKQDFLTTILALGQGTTYFVAHCLADDATQQLQSG